MEECLQCGLCAENCPIIPYTDIGHESPQDIQASVHKALEAGVPNSLASGKAFACMECFKCTTDICPQELNPMLVNPLIKGESIAQGLAERAYGDQQEPESIHRVLACVQVSGADYQRISTPSPRRNARFVFFPGCNVYFHPEMILNALDILESLGEDAAYLPGLDFCCGDSFFFQGDIERASQEAEKLVTALTEFQPEAVILWCPTCLCNFAATISQVYDLPFEVLSFPQYLAANMQKLPLSTSVAGEVTLHEACKAAYMELDIEGPREVLRQLPGLRLTEMEHHGREASCCGSGAICWYPESCAQIRQDRLQEAAQTGAGRMVTICHYCNQTFAAEAGRFDLEVINYISLVATAMGIHREDAFSTYRLWGDLERILQDAEANIQGSPFSRDRIHQVLQTVFQND